MIERLVMLVVCVGIAVLGLLLVRRQIPLERLQEQHEVAGVAYAVLGSLYGVILAFVLVMSWERFESIRRTIELEADAVGNLRRHAPAYQPNDAAALQKAVLRYVESVATDEWPAMADGRKSEETWTRYTELWNVLLAVNPANDKQNALWQDSLDQMDELAGARRERLLFSGAEIPSMVWGFLVTFGIVTVGFTYFFGMRSAVAQALITAALAATIASTLTLILETQTPFSGALRLSAHPFELLLERIRVEDGVPPDAAQDRSPGAPGHATGVSSNAG